MKMTVRNEKGIFALALTCFIASLLMPSVRLNILGAPTTFYGWRAVAWAVGLGWDFITQPSSVGFLGKAGFLILGIAGAFNIVFLLTPIMLTYCSTARRVTNWLGMGAIVGILFGMGAPFVLVGIQLNVLIGYFVWLLGYGFLLWSLTIVRRQQRGQRE